MAHPKIERSDKGNEDLAVARILTVVHRITLGLIADEEQAIEEIKKVLRRFKHD